MNALPSKWITAADRLQSALLAMPQPDCPVTHRFTPGLYIREVFMPKGCIFMSKIHKTEHPFVLSKGSLSILTEGGEVLRLNAPHTGITKPGSRRIAAIHEDVIWTTFHPTNETDVDKIEEAIIEKRDILPLADQSLMLSLERTLL